MDYDFYPQNNVQFIFCRLAYSCLREDEIVIGQTFFVNSVYQ